MDDFIAPDVQLTHLENLRVFKRQLEELLVVYSYQIDYSDFNRVYKQRYGRNLDFSSFGVDSMDSLVAKVIIGF